MALTVRNGYRSDAEACGKVVLEILGRRKPNIWRHLTEEGDYLAWLARWAFHWAELARRHAAAETV